MATPQVPSELLSPPVWRGVFGAPFGDCHRWGWKMGGDTQRPGSLHVSRSKRNHCNRSQVLSA